MTSSFDERERASSGAETLKNAEAMTWELVNELNRGGQPGLQSDGSTLQSNTTCKGPVGGISKRLGWGWGSV